MTELASEGNERIFSTGTVEINGEEIEYINTSNLRFRLAAYIFAKENPEHKVEARPKSKLIRENIDWIESDEQATAILEEFELQEPETFAELSQIAHQIDEEAEGFRILSDNPLLMFSSTPPKGEATEEEYKHREVFFSDTYKKLKQLAAKKNKDYDIDAWCV